ncbi:MAG: radical SAM protein [Armatimonadota bacterium]
MPGLEQRDYTYFATVRGMCRECREVGPARVFFRDGSVWQQSLCPDCQSEPALIAEDQGWYLRQVLRALPDRSPLAGARSPRRGCPHDCGPCTWHANPCQLPVFSVTNACSLNCPICFTYNRSDRVWHMSVDEARRTVDWVIESSGPVDLINITGGEPTLHPQILAILRECVRPEIGRITMNSNGLRLAEDYELCEQLAELGVCVVLSFNTFDPKASVAIHGRDVVAAKLAALDNLMRAGVRTTLLYVLIRGMNEDALGGLLALLRQRERILSLTIQTMTYTGQGGGSFPHRLHVPVDAATRLVCEASGGMLEPTDFMPRPSAHPLCYAVSYLLKADDRMLPMSRFLPRDRLQAMLRDSYLIRLEGEDSLREMMDDAYARNEVEAVRLFRGLIERLFPKEGALGSFERQRLAEESVRTIYVHAHMDEDTFDCTRAMLCPDLVPSEPGRLIPACTYNLFYRMEDDRFYCNASADRASNGLHGE